eukprot:TRINITY_DN7405_c0_g2_i12.p1 TRINITY_DN7405_c0_g2~~TRINITY_DN7405_c0_g2_i12.p1  ORF type:complete len:587 (-),score=96.35 TRINITY_DN7405_c0_g2_i12:474-2159(-)
MSKDLKKIDLAKQAIKKMMGHLTPSDKMAVVTFARSANVHVNLEFVTPGFVSAAGSKVDSIGVGGVTNLESGQKAATFKRKDLDLVVVLDVSGSMSSRFGQYDGQMSKDLKKIDLAKQAIKKMMGHLTPSDKMAVVTFARSANVHVNLEFVTPGFVSAAGSKVDSIGVGGVTNLESGQKAATFKRKDLDLVVVLDVSGSMGEKFGQYDGSSSKDLTKIDVAKQAIKNMMKHLTPSDKMAVVTFAISAKVQVDLEFVTPRFVSAAGSKVDSIGVGGITNLESGLKVAASLMQRDSRENRLIVITDANANSGEYSEQGLATIISDLANAADPIYTSLIGVGLDFNSDLTNAILKTKGANYFTVYSPEELSKKLDEEFDYMVSPFLFDLELEFDPDSLNGADGWKILQAFGVPADAAGVQSSGQILKVSTLFPSPKTAEGTKGGIILLQLKRTDNPKPLYIKVSYMDQDFWLYAGSSEVQLFKDPNVEFYGSDAIRKAILLSRYVDVLKFWLDGVSGNQLVVSKESADDFIAFLAYMNEQKEILKDSRLDREITLLKKLISLGI